MYNKIPILIDSAFCEREQQISFNDQLLKVITTKEEIEMDGFMFNAFNYYLYSANSKVCNDQTYISKCQIAVVDGNPGYNKVLTSLGTKEVPLNYIWLKKIYTPDTKRKGYGSVILNMAISDVLDLSKYIGQNLPILFNEIKTRSTNVFYRNFNADENVDLFRYSTYSPMIIKNPQIYYKHNAKVLKTKVINQAQPQ